MEDNSFSGVHYRLAKKLYQHAGLQVEFTHVPYSRMQQQVAHGDVSFINYGEVENVKTEDILHVCVPPTKITLRVYYLDDNLDEIYSKRGFEHQNVIIIQGLPLGDYESIKTNEKVNFMRPRSVASAIKGLVTG